MRDLTDQPNVLRRKKISDPGNEMDPVRLAGNRRRAHIRSIFAIDLFDEFHRQWGLIIVHARYVGADRELALSETKVSDALISHEPNLEADPWYGGPAHIGRLPLS